MIRKTRKILYWFGLAIGAGLFAWQLVGVFQSLRSNALVVLSPAALVLAFAALILLIYMQMINWRQILLGSEYPLGMRDLVRGYTLSLLPRYIPGTVWGYISRGEWLYQRFRVPYSVVSFSSVLEVLVTVISSLMVIGYFLVLSNPLALAIRVVLIAAISLLPVLVWLLVGGFVKLRPQGKLRKFFSANPVKNIPIRNWLACILNFLGQWVLLGITVLLINGAFYPHWDGLMVISPWNLSIATYAFSLAWLAGFIILFVPGGIGVREVMLSMILASSLPVSYPQAVLVAVLSRGLYSIAEIFWILAGLFIDKSLKI